MRSCGCLEVEVNDEDELASPKSRKGKNPDWVPSISVSISPSIVNPSILAAIESPLFFPHPLLLPNTRTLTKKTKKRTVKLNFTASMGV